MVAGPCHRRVIARGAREVRAGRGWLVQLTRGAALAFNALWFPRTFFGAHYYDEMVQSVGPFHVGQLIYGSTAIFAAVVAVAGGAAWLSRKEAARRRRYLKGLALLGFIALTYWASPWLFSMTSSISDTDRPNVILLGIDSLRLEELERFGGTRGNTTHIDSFLRDADIFKDASTPMARTFGSWVAILTGRSPPITGARNNLTPGTKYIVNLRSVTYCAAPATARFTRPTRFDSRTSMRVMDSTKS